MSVSLARLIPSCPDLSAAVVRFRYRLRHSLGRGRLDPADRFAERAHFYAAFRPAYPDSVMDFLRQEARLRPGSVVVDAGAGTGLSAALFLRHGYRVIGVEPNEDMRRQAADRLRQYPAFEIVPGRAEATGLPDSCADLVVCAASFHWFDAAGACAEFRRLLRPPRTVAILNNFHRRRGSEFMQAYAKLFRRYALDPAPRLDRLEAARRLLGGEQALTWTAGYEEQLDFDTLTGRLCSYAALPPPGHALHQAMMSQLRVIFDRAARDGRVAYLGEVIVLLGRLD